MPWLKRYSTKNWSERNVTNRERQPGPESVGEPLVHRLQIQDSSRTETISDSGVSSQKNDRKGLKKARRESYHKKRLRKSKTLQKEPRWHRITKNSYGSKRKTSRGTAEVQRRLLLKGNNEYRNMGHRTWPYEYKRTAKRKGRSVCQK